MDAIEVAYWEGVDVRVSQEAVLSPEVSVDVLMHARGAFELYGWNDPLFLLSD